VLRSRDVLGRAIAQKAFSRAFRNESKADQGLAAEVETGLETVALVALRRAIESGEVNIAAAYDGAGTVLAEIVRPEEPEKNDDSGVRIISILTGEVGRAFLNAAILLQEYRSPATNIVAKQTKLPDTRRGIPQDMD
jgi:hypothetical protein